MINLSYKHYMLTLLTVVAGFNYLDRIVLSMMLESIKFDLNLSDSQLGFMTGFAFAVFYALAGIPIARWADKGNRNTVVTLTTGLWSAMVAVCGLVSNYGQLLLVRVGVAVGEAGCVPPAQSLISEYFDRAERPKAMAIYSLCGPIALVLGYLAGGWLVEKFGWRATFVIIGVPGVLIAVLVKYTLRESRLTQGKLVMSSQTPLISVLSSLWSKPTFRHILMAFCVNYFLVNGTSQWTPAFFIRSHNMNLAELGVWFAVIYGVSALFGNILGGYLTVRYLNCKERLQMRVMAFLYLAVGLSLLSAYLSDNNISALMSLAFSWFLMTLCSGALLANIQSLVTDDIRSLTFALIMLFANLIGFGLGPLAVGCLSDYLTSFFVQDSLRYALVFFVPTTAWVAFHFWMSGITIEKDILDTQSLNNSSISLDTDSEAYHAK